MKDEHVRTCTNPNCGVRELEHESIPDIEELKKKRGNVICFPKGGRKDH